MLLQKLDIYYFKKLAEIVRFKNNDIIGCTYPKNGSIPSKSHNQVNFHVQERYLRVCETNQNKHSHITTSICQDMNTNEMNSLITFKFSGFSLNFHVITFQ